MNLQTCQSDLTRILYIDLTKRSFRVEDRPDIFQDSIGGSGAAIRLLEENCPVGADPLGPENPIIFAVGPLVGLYPLASKTIAMFKSPHTGNLGESHAGGRSAVSIRMAGYGAIVITGKSEIPIFLDIDEVKVSFKDATSLWGMSSSFSVGSVLRGMTDESGFRTIMRIGRAGEKQVSYACVVTETFRHFGRLGLGAVFGSKLLKGVVVSGKRSIPVADKKAYRKVYDEIFHASTSSSVMQKYHELGTAVNVWPLNNIGGLPTRNLQSGKFELASNLSGEHLATHYLGRRVACAHCPVACIHLAALRIPYPHDPYFYKTIMIGYDHELIYAVGSMLGIGDTEKMLMVIDEVEIQGMDMMTTGVVLAWATEAFQRGLITTQDTGDLKPDWGNAEIYIEMIRRIVQQPNDFYRALAHGVEHAASIYGGMDFALSFGKNEMPGYHTGPACHLGYLTGARHSHLDSAGYSLDQKAAATGKPLTPDDVAEALVKEEWWRQILTSLTICLFARGIYTPDVSRRALEAAGFPWNEEDFDRIGKDILLRKQLFKVREGFDLKSLRLPKRIFETAAPAGSFDESFMRQAIQKYAEMTGLIPKEEG